MDLRLAVLDSNADTAAAGASSPLKPSERHQSSSDLRNSFDGFAKFAATRRAPIEPAKMAVGFSKRR